MKKKLFTYIMSGALTVGFISFLCGFFGPMVFMPESNIGPLVGIIFTGPIGFIVGGIIGLICWYLEDEIKLKSDTSKRLKIITISVVIVLVVSVLSITLRQIYINHQKSDREKLRVEKSELIYKRKCSSGDMQMCVNLGKIKLKKQNKKEAKKLYVLACENNFLAGCFQLGQLEENKHKKKAKIIYQQVCDKGLVEGCIRLGYLARLEGNKVEAERINGGLCKKKIRKGCFELWQLGLKEKRKGNLAEATKLFQRACDGGINDSCKMIGKY